MLEVTLLSILQGVAEFLPISSSGHLVITQHLLGVNAPGMRLDVMLHVGTLLSIIVFYFSVIRRVVAGFEWRYMLKVLLSTLPAILVYFCFGEAVESIFENAKAVGALLIFTGVVLVGTRFLPKGDREVGWSRALLMGAAQAVALLPGVSRSGMTLTAARALRVDAAKSAEFSFLMSAPLIAGAALLEIIKGFRGVEADAVSWALAGYGALLAAVVGYFSLAVLLRILKGDRFWIFGIYCLGAGLLTVLLV